MRQSAQLRLVSNEIQTQPQFRLPVPKPKKLAARLNDDLNAKARKARRYGEFVVDLDRSYLEALVGRSCFHEQTKKALRRAYEQVQDWSVFEYGSGALAIPADVVAAALWLDWQVIVDEHLNAPISALDPLKASALQLGDQIVRQLDADDCAESRVFCFDDAFLQVVLGGKRSKSFVKEVLDVVASDHWILTKLRTEYFAIPVNWVDSALVVVGELK